MADNDKIKDIFIKRGLELRHAEDFIRENEERNWHFQDGNPIKNPNAIAVKYAEGLKKKIDEDQEKKAKLKEQREVRASVALDSKPSTRLQEFLAHWADLGMPLRDGQLIAYELDSVGWVDKHGREVVNLKSYAHYRKLIWMKSPN